MFLLFFFTFFNPKVLFFYMFTFLGFHNILDLTMVISRYSCKYLLVLCKYHESLSGMVFLSDTIIELFFRPGSAPFRNCEIIVVFSTRPWDYVSLVDLWFSFHLNKWPNMFLLLTEWRIDAMIILQPKKKKKLWKNRINSERLKSTNTGV